MSGGKIFGLFSLEAVLIGFLGSAIGAAVAVAAGTCSAGCCPTGCCPRCPD
ncbi:hypothetical protein QJS66_17330 [Kocuria rhizophila]|nr:hypothetical protein QJS66_17330 [Kocuria rhizophila]